MTQDKKKPVNKIEYFDRNSILEEGDADERNLIQLLTYLEDHSVSKKDPQIGLDHFNLFAEVHHGSAESESDDWFIKGSGRIFSLDQLNDQEAQQIKNRYDKIKIDITKIAQQYMERQDEYVANTLINALKIPDSSSIYAGEFQDKITKELHKSPITINWGFKKRNTTKKIPKGLIGFGTGQTKTLPKEPIPFEVRELEPVDRKPLPKDQKEPLPNSNKLLTVWLLIAMLIAVIMYLLIPACGIKNTVTFQKCDQQVLIDRADETNADLINRVQAYERELLFLLNECKSNLVGSQSQPLDRESNNISLPRNVEDRLKSENATIGDLNFSLIWNDLADLDLKVMCPSGREIGYFGKTNSCGTLDVDANYVNRRLDPVEHILINDPEGGTYNVQVSQYSSDGATSNKVKFQLEIHSETQKKSLRGKVNQALPWSHEFNYVSIK